MILLRLPTFFVDSPKALGLEMRVHIQDMCTLEVNQRGGDVGLAGALARAHHVLDALVEQLGSHDHAIRSLPFSHRKMWKQHALPEFAFSAASMMHNSVPAYFAFPICLRL
jgi:hypothetical protein